MSDKGKHSRSAPPAIDIPLAGEEALRKPRPLPRGKRARPLSGRQKLWIGVRSFLLLGTAAALLVLIYSYGSSLSPAGVRRLVDYVGSGFQSKPLENTLDLTVGSNAALFPSDGGTYVASADGISFYDADGATTRLSQTAFRNPFLESAGGRLLAADRGGTSFSVVKGNSIVFSQETEAPIVSARISEGGVALSIAQKGYLCGVTVYNSSFKESLRYSTSDYFGVDAVVSRDGRTLAFLGVSAGAFSMQATLLLIDVNSASILHRYVLEDVLPLALYQTGDYYCLVTDRSVVFVDGEGNEKARTSFGSMELRGYSASPEGALVLLDRKMAGARYRLLSLGADGSVIGEREEQNGLAGFALGRNLVALAYPDRALLLDASFHELGEVSLASRPTRIAADGGSRFAFVQDGLVTLLSK